MSSAVQDRSRHPRSRAARAQPVPRPQPAGRLAARVRRPGHRPGAGRRLPHRRGARRRIRCTPISCGRAIRRCRSSTRSTASATARASPPAAWSRSSTARRSSPCRCRSRCRGARPRATRRRCPTCRARSTCRARPRCANACCPLMPEPVRRYYERERPIELRPVEFDRYLGRKYRRRAVQRLDPRDRRAAGRPGDPSMRARLCLRHDAARHRAAAARPHRVRPGHQAASLDHALWFHRPFRADDWLLYAQDSPNLRRARAASPAA